MDFDLDRIVNGKRATSAGYHFLAGRGWRLFGEPQKLHSPLAYSAFEFRCSIERSAFELFILIKGKKLSARDLKAADRFSSLRNAILKSEGGKKMLLKKLEFSRLYAQASGLPRQYWHSVPDIGILERFWLHLSEYCHRQLEPRATWESMGGKWIDNGYKLLNEVERYLWDITVTHQIGWFDINTLPPEMVQTREEFIRGRIDTAAVVTRVQLMEPVIRARAKRKLVGR